MDGSGKHEEEGRKGGKRGKQRNKWSSGKVMKKGKDDATKAWMIGMQRNHGKGDRKSIGGRRRQEQRKRSTMIEPKARETNRERKPRKEGKKERGDQQRKETRKGRKKKREERTCWVSFVKSSWQRQSKSRQLTFLT
jgi:hypothetical protein